MRNFGKGSQGSDSLERQLLNVQALNLVNLSLGNAIDTDTPARLKRQIKAAKSGDWFTAARAKRDREGTFLPVVPPASYDFALRKNSTQIPVGMLNSAALTPTYKAPGVPDFDEMKRQTVAAAMSRVDQAVSLNSLDRQRVKDAVVRSVRFGQLDPKDLNRIVGYAQGGSGKIARLVGAGEYGASVDHHSLPSLMLELDGKFNNDKGYWRNRDAVKSALAGRLNAAGMSSDETHRLALRALGRTDELARIDALQGQERYKAAHRAELDATNPNQVGGPKQSWAFATDYGRVLPRQQDSEANRRVMSNGVYMALDGPIDQMGQWMDVSGFAASMADAGVDIKDIKAFHHQLGTLGFSLMGAGTGEVSQAANIFLTANQRARNVAVLSDRYATREQKDSAIQDLVLDAASKFNQETRFTEKLKQKLYSQFGGKVGARLRSDAFPIESMSPGEDFTNGSVLSRAKMYPDPTVERYVDISGKKKAGVLEALAAERTRGSAFKDNHLGYVAAREFVRSPPDPLLNEMELVFQHSIPVPRGARPRGLYEVSTDIARIAREYRGHDLFGTIVHEVAHHLENFLTHEDFKILVDQFNREKMLDIARRRGRRYDNVSEWWAEKVRERIHSELLTPREIARYDHPVENLLVKSKEFVMAGLRSTYASLIRLGRKDNAAELYDKLINLERKYGGPESYGKAQLLRDSGFLGKKAGSVRK